MCCAKTAIITEDVLFDILKVFSTCRLELDKREQLLELSRIKFDEQELLNPTMRFYNLVGGKKVIESDNVNLSRLKDKVSERIFDKKNQTVPVSFTFKKALSLLEENEIRIIEVKMKYVRCELKIYFDLRDVLNKDGELTRTYVYPRVIGFDGKYYRLPYGIAAFDHYKNAQKNKGKEWRDVDDESGWFYQENVKKDYVQIVDDRNCVVFFSDKPSKRKQSDKVWKLVKEWLGNGKDGYWKKVMDKPCPTLESALNLK